MNKINNKGFTLIELLVVITIIGILSSVVLVSLGGAQNLANDNTAKIELGQLRALSAQAGQSGTLPAGFCSTTGGSLTASDNVELIINAIAGKVSINNVACEQSGNKWIAGFVQLTDDGGADQAWCVDSQGSAKSVAPTALLTPDTGTGMDAAYGVIIAGLKTGNDAYKCP